MSTTYQLSTQLDIAEEEPLELLVFGLTEEAAWCSMANLLHLEMFQCDVKNNIWKDYGDEYDEPGFIELCRNFKRSGDAITSDLIWMALREAVENVVVTKVDGMV